MKKNKIESNVKDLLDRARKPEKPVFSIRFDKGLYDAFKVRCEGLGAHHALVLEELMRDFLDKTGK